MEHNRRKYVITAAALFGIVVVIFWNSCLDRQVSGRISGILAETLQSFLDPEGKIGTEQFHSVFRKAAHFAEFAVFGGILGVAADKIRCRSDIGIIKFPVRTAFLTAFMVASADEFIQIFSRGRSPMLKDVVLDFGGAVTGIVLAMFLISFRRKRKKK